MPNERIEKTDSILEERSVLAGIERMHGKAWASANRQTMLAEAIMNEFGDANGDIDNPAVFQQYRSHLDAAASALRQADTTKRLFEAHAETYGELVKVKSEPRTYSPLRDASWFMDRAAIVTDPTGQTVEGRQAKENLARYSKELATELRNNPTSAEGRHILRTVREQYRTSDYADGERTARQITQEVERRAADTGAGSLGAFVTPVYVIADAAQYRTPVAAFTDESNDQVMPPYGLALHIPSFTSDTSVGEQVTENTGIDSSTPSGAYIGDPIPVVTQAGTVNISQQLADRGGYAGSGFDSILLAALTEKLDSVVDAYVLATVIASSIAASATVTDSTTVTVPRFYDDLSTARENLRNTAGVRLSASHVFAHFGLHRRVAVRPGRRRPPSSGGAGPAVAHRIAAVGFARPRHHVHGRVAEPSAVVRR